LVVSTNNNSTTVNGIVYEGLDQDLAIASNIMQNTEQKQKALQIAKAKFIQKQGRAFTNYQSESIKPIIYVDNNKQAHYAFLTSFYADDGVTGPHRPKAIIDANTLTVYRSWDQVKTSMATAFEQPETIIAGGIGGNEKIDHWSGRPSQIIYDGGSLPGHLAPLKMMRYRRDNDAVCLLANEEVMVIDTPYAAISAGPCPSQIASLIYSLPWLDVDENGTRWKQDEANGAYSPSLDALYTATVIKKFYQDWYKIPVLINEDGSPMQLLMRVHYGRSLDNAFWDGEYMSFGDGSELFYPLVSMDVATHEISHGFTDQHAKLDPTQLQMNGLNESFSDMAAIAVQFYLHNSTTWDIGRSIIKGEGAMRYLNNPSKDGTSIANMRDYRDDLDQHDVAGIFNKAFYLIATAPGWDVHQAFNIMVKANMNYWTSSMQTLTEAACGVVSAAKDYHYPTNDVKSAFNQVGITLRGC